MHAPITENFSKARINANEGVLGQGLGPVPGQRNETGATSPITATYVGKVKGKSAYTATPGLVAADKYTPGLYAASRCHPQHPPPPP